MGVLAIVELSEQVALGMEGDKRVLFVKNVHETRASDLTDSGSRRTTWRPIPE
jgi:hypothetical protein